MPEAVKISELPVMSTVQAGDIVPVVDAQLTQTGRATAAQIAAIGGGPPGDNTVSTAKMQDGAVTAAKVGFTGPDKLISRTAAGAGGGTEIACTSYARGLLAVSGSAGALSYLGGLQSSESPTFTGTVTVAGDLNVSGSMTGQIRTIDGTLSAPSYSFAGDTDTGLARLGGGNTLSVVTGGQERLRFESTGALSAPITAGGALYPVYLCRAWANIYGGLAGGNPPTSGDRTITIRGAGNISSVTRLSGFGAYRVNFATAMPDANYAAMWSVSRNNDGNFYAFIGHGRANAYTANGFEVLVGFDNENFTCDTPNLHVAVFR